MAHYFSSANLTLITQREYSHTTAGLNSKDIIPLEQHEPWHLHQIAVAVFLLLFLWRFRRREVSRLGNGRLWTIWKRAITLQGKELSFLWCTEIWCSSRWTDWWQQSLFPSVSVSIELRQRVISAWFKIPKFFFFFFFCFTNGILCGSSLFLLSCTDVLLKYNGIYTLMARERFEFVGVTNNRIIFVIFAQIYNFVTC